MPLGTSLLLLGRIVCFDTSLPWLFIGSLHLLFSQLLPQLYDFLFPAPHIRQEDLDVRQYSVSQIFEVLLVQLQLVLPNLMLTLIDIDEPAHVLLDFDRRYVTAGLGQCVAESSHAVHLPLSLDLGHSSGFHLILFLLNCADDNGPKLALYFGRRLIHDIFELSLLDQRMQVENVHIQHRLLREVAQQALIRLDHIVDDLPPH